MKSTIKSNKLTIPILIIGGIIVAGILVIGTVLSGQEASNDTSKAVRNVSLLYLDELAGRREQVVESVLDDYVSDIDIALGLMEGNDLSSQENFQAYQARMKQLYGFEKFAFVSSDGLIYTSRGTRNDINEYSFDPNNLTGPQISIKSINGDNKKVIIAVPVDSVNYLGNTLVACFVEIDMNKMLTGISLQSTDNNTTFCNLYTKDGVALTNTVLGGLASEDNLMDALSHADFEEDYSLESIKRDFAEKKKGVVSFTYNNIKETLYYIPVTGTDWMLTYLIRESVISEQINTISSQIIIRSLILSGIAAIILAAIFIFVIIQTKRSANATLEKEISETENRVHQQELEEQLSLQEELLEQEKHRTQQNSMITALASDYKSVYYVDLDTDDGICYQNDPEFNETIHKDSHFHFASTFTEYAEKYIDKDYRDGFLDFIKPSSIREKLSNEIIIGYRYLVKKDGKERYEMLRMAGVRHPEDRTDHRVHAVGVGFSDIDSEMRESLARGQALKDALSAAEEASKAKTVFLSNMSHEIRTPMNAIIGLNSLALNEEGISDTTKEYLEKIDGAAQHLLSLINDILDMSRIESGRTTINNEEFAFSKLIEQVNTICGGQCEEKGLKYNCIINGELNDYYIGDTTKLKQVLINILGNAVKFTPEGGNIDFTIEKVGSFDNKTTLKFIIKDNGIGMSKDYIPKIFETFSQEDDSASTKYSSSGLGMAITKNIVEMMNGKIDVESEKGVGTTFTVTITLSDSEHKTTNDMEDIDVNPEELTVLVIDDDPVACDHAKLVLSQAGITSEIALSGKDAIDMIKLRHARMEPYNLIIVDWKMPDMDGVETTRQIRSEIGDESAIIILTAYNWDDILEDATEAGVDRFISKPLFTNNLIDEFKEALKNKAKDTSSKKANLDGLRFLIAEDMEINAEILINILELRNIKSEHAINGKVCLEMFENSPEGYFDAILMDMRMPEMNGLEATEKIRALDREDAKEIPIIALTANAFDEDVQRSLQAGLNAHLSKPIEPDVLFETLENIL
ncbi:MAG: response regulator [Lachnospiraceae bacterium]|nr:response regulator [Lachnospiraceae bacterium]